MNSLLEQARAYKTLLDGSFCNLFNGVMVCKVSGVTFDGRQKFLAEVEKDTPLRLVRDRRNEHDFYAVSIYAFIDGAWRDIGFLPKEVNKDIALALDSGIQTGAQVWRKVGGEGDFYHGLYVTVKRIEENKN